MRHIGSRRLAALALSLVALAATGCKGDDDTAARAPTTRGGSTTAVTSRVEGAALDATTTTTATAVGPTATTSASAQPTPTTARPESRANPTVNDAPRDAHEEKTDNSGRLTYSATPVNRVTPAERGPNDPLEFTISCAVDPDGHGTCTMRMVNDVTRAAQFPGGLKIVVTMVRTGGSTATFPMDLPNVSSLAPGEQAHIEGTFDLTEQGEWTYSATTTVAWP